MNGELSKALKKRDDKLGFAVQESSIILGYVGSLAHGTYVPKEDPNSIDDKDVMGIYIPPKDYFFGLKEIPPRNTQFWDGVWDITLYEIRKFFRLLLNQNPNVISLLWLEQNDYLRVTELGQKLIDNRELFSSRAAYHSFNGYAHGQLKRMTHLAYEGYMGKKRKELVDKFGYDCKNGAHLIRILRMGVEFLTEGRMYVKREDSAELLQIKRGEYSLERIQKMADELFNHAHEAYIHSPLPAQPDREKINKLCTEIVEEYFADNSTR